MRDSGASGFEAQSPTCTGLCLQMTIQTTRVSEMQRISFRHGTGRGLTSLGRFGLLWLILGVSGTGEALAFETLRVCKRTNYEDTSDASSGLRAHKQSSSLKT